MFSTDLQIRSFPHPKWQKEQNNVLHDFKLQPFIDVFKRGDVALRNPKSQEITARREQQDSIFKISENNEHLKV